MSRSVYTSAPFKFIVDGEPLYIHADLASFHSKPLDRMINGHMAEAQKGFATLEDVDQGTFVRFIEWAHRGYYTAGKFTTVEVASLCAPISPNHGEVFPAAEEAPACAEVYISESAPLEPQPEVALDYSSFKKSKKGKKGTQLSWEEPDVDDIGWGFSKKGTAQEMKQDLKEAFIRRRDPVRQSALKFPPPRPNRKPEEDYTDVFLSHAQLYVFAEKYDIQLLKALALEELHATLAIYTLYPVRTGDIIALLRYVYGNTGQSNGGEEELRKVLTTYIGYEMDTLMKDEEFNNLMIEDGGPLLGDFMTMVGRRIS